MPKELEIVVLPGGKVRVELHGYVGQECERDELVNCIRDLLSQSDEEPKTEFWMSQEQSQTQGL